MCVRKHSVSLRIFVCVVLFDTVLTLRTNFDVVKMSYGEFRVCVCVCFAFFGVCVLELCVPLLVVTWVVAPPRVDVISNTTGCSTLLPRPCAGRDSSSI